MALILGLIVIWILCSFVCGGNVFFGFLLAVGICIVVTFCQCQDDKLKNPKTAPKNEELEKTVYEGLENNWNCHTVEGNKYVPKEYVGYMEHNRSAWSCWARARTNEIMIAKGYMGSKISSLSSFDVYSKKRVDHSSHSALYEDFNSTYLPLIEYYNKTGKVVYKKAALPTEMEKKNNYTNAVLEGYRLDGKQTLSKTASGKKKYSDSVEILCDIRLAHGESKYDLYRKWYFEYKRTHSEQETFDALCRICERKGLLDIKASEQKMLDKDGMISEDNIQSVNSVENTNSNTKKYSDVEEILEDLKRVYSEEIYSRYYKKYCEIQYNTTHQDLFNIFCKECEKDGYLGIVTSEQHYKNKNKKHPAVLKHNIEKPPIGDINALWDYTIRHIQEEFGEELKKVALDTHMIALEENEKKRAVNELYPRYRLLSYATTQEDEAEAILSGLSQEKTMHPQWRVRAEYGRTRQSLGDEEAIEWLRKEVISVRLSCMATNMISPDFLNKINSVI